MISLLPPHASPPGIRLGSRTNEIQLAMHDAYSEIVDHSAGGNITKIVQNHMLMPSIPDNRRTRPRNTEGTSKDPWAARPGRHRLDAGEEVTRHLSMANGAMADGENSGVTNNCF
ncbi:hypothetical protein CFIO01_02105 [Colletotrichum fioriniae PJ7]|uniref:Uncharacterized protein n=1 Tax=Colletotrichum fioriniae PJ7 TaxID=1445577 RepID=A0A010QRT5_9PEZI|nr:hypothetical protein CFIO01_02105 [Colletotrichum fioriniae PJ7]